MALSESPSPHREPAVPLVASPAAALPAARRGRGALYQISPVALFASLLLVATPALPASGPEDEVSEPPAGGQIQSIEITGQRPGVLRRLMDDFILEIGETSGRSRGYARWRDRLCVGVFNLPDQEAAQYIADKISLIAVETGVKTGSPGCRANLQIVFSPDGRELANRMVEDTPLMFMPFGNTEGTTRGRAALELFRTSDAPVRWWQITMVVDEVGNPAIQLPGQEDVPVVRGEASRLTSGLSDAIWGGIIIVDANKLGGVEWPQLADYLAMVALAQIDPKGRPTGYDSILNLFTADSPPKRMTEMDEIYLRALYEMDTMMLPYTQRGILSHRMVRVQREME